MRTAVTGQSQGVITEVRQSNGPVAILTKGSVRTGLEHDRSISVLRGDVCAIEVRASDLACELCVGHVQVNGLIENYLRSERTIILAIVPANQDVATVDILERAKKVRRGDSDYIHDSVKASCLRSIDQAPPFLSA